MSYSYYGKSSRKGSKKNTTINTNFNAGYSSFPSQGGQNLAPAAGGFNSANSPYYYQGQTYDSPGDVFAAPNVTFDAMNDPYPATIPGNTRFGSSHKFSNKNNYPSSSSFSMYNNDYTSSSYPTSFTDPDTPFPAKSTYSNVDKFSSTFTSYGTNPKAPFPSKGSSLPKKDKLDDIFSYSPGFNPSRSSYAAKPGPFKLPHCTLCYCTGCIASQCNGNPATGQRCNRPIDTDGLCEYCKPKV